MPKAASARMKVREAGGLSHSDMGRKSESFC